jgi:hypothetical protein
MPDLTFVRLEEHTLGPHALEVWGPAASLRTQRTTAPSPLRGEPIGTCIRCDGDVGREEWTFGGWDGQNWRFSGYTLPAAKRLAMLRPLLCCGCAVLAKYGLIPMPPPFPPTTTGREALGQ